MTDPETLARALQVAHWDALDTLHPTSFSARDRTSFDLLDPARRAYLTEQAAALLAAGWVIEPPPNPRWV